MTEAPGPVSSMVRPVDSEPAPRTMRRGNRPWRSIFFAPIGDGQTRRRGSDGFRLAAAVVIVVLCWLITRANSDAEHTIATTMASAARRHQLAGLGHLVGGLDRRHRPHRWCWPWCPGAGRPSATSDSRVCWPRSSAWSSAALLGIHRGPSARPLPGHFDLSFPVARVAATVGGGHRRPALSQPLAPADHRRGHRPAGVATVVNGSGLPVSVLASIALGWGVTALVHLVVGSPLGLPSDRGGRASPGRSRTSPPRPWCPFPTRSGVWAGSPARSEAPRSTSRSTGVTPPTPSCWPRPPASSSTATPGRPWP